MLSYAFTTFAQNALSLVYFQEESWAQIPIERSATSCAGDELVTRIFDVW